MDSTDISCGAKFAHFDSLSSALASWEKINLVNLYIRSSRTIQGARKRVPKRILNDNLKFYSIHLCCIHGGRKAKSTSHGKRPNQSTFIQDCPFFIKVGVTSDGNSLVVQHMSDAACHNHDINEQAFSFFPKQRRINGDDRAYVGEMLKIKANKKLIQQHVKNQTGKRIILKDLHNIASEQHKGLKNDFEELINEMKKLEGAAVEAFVNNDSILQAVYFQTEEMKQTFEAYSELLLIDGTYKLNDLRMPLYIMMCVDGNGESEIICLWLLSSEDRQTIAALMDAFKTHNPTWDKIAVIMADKDITEHDVLTNKLPNADILICLFHTLRTFRREVSIEKMGISASERIMCLEMLGKLAVSKTGKEYDDHYRQFVLSAPTCKSVIKYFDDNWHNIRQEWVEGFKAAKANFLNNTNNRLEATNGKLKSVITRYSGMTVFFRDLMACINSLKNERDCRAVNVTAKVPIYKIQAHEPEALFQKLLTPYAFSFVQREIKYSKEAKVVKVNDKNSAVVSSKSYGEITTTTTSCPCRFFTSMLLPCHHILAVRNKLEQSVYDEHLCSKRWTKAYFLKNHRVYRERELVSERTDSSFEVPNIQHLDTSGSRVALTEQQKYRQAHSLLLPIAQIISNQGTNDFRKSMDVLQHVKSYLEKGKAFTVVELVQLCAEQSEQVHVLPIEPEHLNKGGSKDSAMNVAADSNLGFPINIQELTCNNSNAEQVLQIESESLNKGAAKDSDMNVAANLNLGFPINVQEFTRNSSNAEDSSTSDVSLNVKMPLKMLKRGRPKGAGLTVIGVPCKRKKNRPGSFRLKSPMTRSEVMLGWFVDRILYKQFYVQMMFLFKKTKWRQSQKWCL